MNLLHLLEIINLSKARRTGIYGRPSRPNKLISCATLGLWTLFLYICVGADTNDLPVLGLYQFLKVC